MSGADLLVQGIASVRPSLDLLPPSQNSNLPVIMLASLPTGIRIAILLCSGAVLGVLINWAIYAWAMLQERPISPWMKPADGESPRTWLDRVPIVGWINRRRDSNIHGAGFWIRPLLIEIVWAIGLPWFYQWQVSGGLTAGVTTDPTWGLWSETWFYAHGILLALMCIGTFIDFDEKTIPDEVTVTGTLTALLFAAFAPWSRLPQVIPGGGAIESINYASPKATAGFHLESSALFIAMLIFAIWVWALLPKLSPFYVGLRKSTRFMLAHAMQPKRKTKCELRTRTRSTPPFTIFLGVLFVMGLVAIAMAWQGLPAQNLESLYGALIGLAFGGGMIWSIRIIGTYAMGQEAMGFGDVTLMAMIGAFLGWQASLLAFVIAPFAALLVVLVQFVVKRENVIAFGPYLCAGAAVLLFYWGTIWPPASTGVFALGPVLLYILLASLVLMAIMLVVIQWFKGLFIREEAV